MPRTLDQEAFIGVLSHELRTPVTTIYGGAQLLATKDLSDGRRRALAADVGQEAERLYRIVEDLVALLRSERGDLTPAREPVALGRLIAAAVDHELSRNPDLRILYLGSSDAAADEADTGLLAHVVRNLLDNAVRYSANGSPIEVIVDTEGDEVVVRVLDRGPGPSEPDRSDLIDPGGTPAALAGGSARLLLQAHTDKSQPLYLDRCALTSGRRRSPAQRGEARQLFHIARLALAQFCLPPPMARKHRARRARRQEEYEFDFS